MARPVQNLWSECLEEDTPSSPRASSSRRGDSIVDLGQFAGLPAHRKVLTLLLLSGVAQGAIQICLASRLLGLGNREVHVYFALDPDEDPPQAPPEGVAEFIVSERRFLGGIVREFQPLPMEVALLVLGEIRRLTGLDSWYTRIMGCLSWVPVRGTFRIRVEEHERTITVAIGRMAGRIVHLLTIDEHWQRPTA